MIRKILIIGRTRKWSLERMLKEAFINVGVKAFILGYEDIITPFTKNNYLFKLTLRQILSQSSHIRERIITKIKLFNYFNNIILKTIEKYCPDCIFIIKGEIIAASTISSLISKFSNMKFIYFNPDDPRYTQSIGALYAYNNFIIFTPCKKCYRIYKKKGARKVYYLPFGASKKNLKKPLPPQRKKHIVFFAGAFYFSRLKIIKRLLSRKVPLLLSGPGWSKIFLNYKIKSIYNLKYILLLNKSLINLNIHHPTDINFKANMRVFEIPAAGGFQVSDNTDIVSQFFSPGKEIICYDNIDNLIELIEYYLNYPEETYDISLRAYKRVLKDHLYVHRVLNILSVI